MGNPFEDIDRRLKSIEDLLLEIKSQSTTPPVAADKVLTVDLAALFLGLSKKAIYNLVSERKIPHNKRGKRLYFSEHDLIKWIKSGRQTTAEQIAQQATRVVARVRERDSGKPLAQKTKPA